MSDPITTQDAASDWLYYTGLTLRITSDDPRVTLPPTALVECVETLRRLMEPTPLERVTPCPESEAAVACKALATGMRHAVEQVSTLRRGANELALHDVARVLWRIGADLSSLAAKVQP